MSPFSPLQPKPLTTSYHSRKRRAFYLLALLAILLSGFSPGPPAAAAAPSTITLIETNEGEYPGGEIPRYHKFEITFDIDEAVSNPYDFDEIWVEGVFTLEETGEALVQPGFYYQEYAITGENVDQPDSATEAMTPVDNPVWMVRFAPSEIGTYTYTIRYRLNQQLQPAQLNGSFEVVDSTSSGFITGGEGKASRYFKFRNGDPFLGVGLNVGWWERDTHGISTYLQFLGRMSEYGANLARVWMTNSVRENPASSNLTAEKILSLQDKVLGGEYNLNDAWKFDRILEESESDNIFLILTLEDGHMFGYKEKDISGLYIGGMWESENLYNVKNGGILSNPYDFFTNEEAKLYAKRLFRYIIARWGYSTSIMSWEYFNEIDELFRRLDYTTPRQEGWLKLYSWTLEMNTFLTDTDAHGHMIDNSMGSFNPELDFPAWELQYYRSEFDALSFAQMHYYYVEGLPVIKDRISEPMGRDMAALTWHYTQQGVEAYPEKPLVIGEFGLVKYDPKNDNWVNSPWLDWDDRGVHLHNGLWASFMSGAAVAGLQWHWHQYWLPDHAWWRHYAALSDFMAGIDPYSLNVLDPIHMEATENYTGVFSDTPPGAEECTDDLCSNHPYLRAMGLQNEGTKATYLWIQNRKNTWWNYVHGWQWECGAAGQPNAELVSGSVRIKGLNPNTAYVVEWWDTYNTSSISEVTQRKFENSGPTGSISLQINNLKEDMAVKVLPAAAALQVNQTVSKSVVQAGGIVNVTTQIWNRGSTTVSNLVVSSDACGDVDAGTLAANSPTPFKVECPVSVDRDTEFISSVVGRDPALNLVHASDRSFVAAVDGIVGSGSPESCTEEALRADLIQGDADTVGFDCGQPYHYYPIFLTEPISLARPLTIQAGPVETTSGMILSGSHRLRVFNVLKPGNLKLDSLRISAGAAHGCTTDPADNQGGGGIDVGGNAFADLFNTRFFGSSGDYGGAIHVHFNGTLSMDRGKLSNNRAEVPETTLPNGTVLTTISTAGGGTYSEGALTVTGTEISNNQAGNGGGLAIYNGTASIDSSAVSNNQAQENGGGLANIHWNGVPGQTETHLTNVTFYGNTAASGSAVYNHLLNAIVHLDSSTIVNNTINITTTTGGAVGMEGGMLYMHNSILARNWDSKKGTRNPSDCAQNQAMVVSQGFNFVGFAGTCFSTEQTGDTFGKTTPLDPLLFSPKKNGGPTSTCALKAGSPALDQGDPNNCPDTDQRGALRPQGSGCDIGAYEAMYVSAEGTESQEGTGATQTLTFTVSLPGTAVQNVQVEYYTVDGTAKGCTGGPCPDGDFIRAAGKLTIKTGESTAPLAVELITDDVEEPDETFRLVLSGSANAFLWEDEAIGTILNDDGPLQNFFAIDDATVTEGDEGAQEAIFQVTLATAEEFTDTVDYTTADDTALAGSDYTAVSGTLMFAPGETMQEIHVPILGDQLDEDTEQFFVRLSNPLLTPLGNSEATGTLLDNDGSMVGNTSYLPVIAKR